MYPYRLITALAALILPLAAEPLPEGHYVDFIVVPVGPVRLAEFEASSTPSTTPKKPGEKEEAQPEGPGGGGGLRVKETDPSEVPPNAVYLKKGGVIYQLPCYLNAIAAPVRVPVADTELTFLTKAGTAKDDFASLDKCQVTKDARCVLVLLTKPLNEKKWTKPTITLIPVPQSQDPQILVANASMGATCGAVFEGSTKIMLPPLKRHVWKPAAGKSGPLAAVALAMNHGGQFLPALYEDRLTLAKGRTSILITYEVTPQESFRCAKYSVGGFNNDEFRPANIYAEKSL
jgi:hypothetical protein